MNKIKFPLIIFGLIFLFVVIFGAIFFYNKYQQALKPEPVLTEIEQIVRQVAALMELPQGETPTLATVSDKTQLQNQDFFQKAENGDRILVYSQAKRAILYRPLTNKIIDIAPITPLEETVPEATAAEIRVALYNASNISGLTSLAEEKLMASKEIADQIQIVAKKEAQNQYRGVLVVDLKGGRGLISDQIAQILGGKVGSLPQEELKPEADILVILGNEVLE